MINVKETLKKLHKKFPVMNLDDLFEILDCYVEQSQFTYPSWEPNKIWYSDKITCKKDNLTTNDNCLKYYDGNTITTAEPSSIQFTTSH